MHLSDKAWQNSVYFKKKFSVPVFICAVQTRFGEQAEIFIYSVRR